LVAAHTLIRHAAGHGTGLHGLLAGTDDGAAGDGAIIVRRDGPKVRLFPHRGYDWTMPSGRSRPGRLGWRSGERRALDASQFVDDIPADAAHLVVGKKLNLAGRRVRGA